MSDERKAATASQVSALFSEHDSPTHASCRDCRQTIAPIADMVLSMQQQIAGYRKILSALELSDHDTAIDGKLEMLHQTLTVMEQAASDFYRTGRRMTTAVAQWERVMADAKVDVARWSGEKPA